MSEKNIINIIKQDAWMMHVLQTVKTLDLPDWLIGAGFVRNKVWDIRHGYTKRTPLNDIDVIYFDKNGFSAEEAKEETTKQEIQYETLLKKQIPGINWSVTNQARMHLCHNDKPYKTTEEALEHWVETATCIGVRIGHDNQLVLVAPFGIDDLVQLIVRPNQKYPRPKEEFQQRVQGKNWQQLWPKLQIQY